MVQEKHKIDFQDILDFRYNDYGYFWYTSHTDTSYQTQNQFAKGCRRSSL